jgi:hypothetical protein
LIKASDQPVNISKDPKIFDHPIAESKNGRAIPPHVPAGWRAPEKRLPVDAVEAQLAGDTVVLFEQIEDVGRILSKRVGDPADIIRELRVPDENRAERSAESEVRIRRTSA